MLQYKHMDNLEYLNQISARANQSNTPKNGGSLLDNKLLVFGLIGAVVIAIILFILMATSSPSEPIELSNLKNLYLRIDNLSSVSEKYKPSVKNSSLRSSGGSLNIILANSQKTFDSILSTKYGVEVSKLATSSELSEEFTNLSSSLEKARLNGILDRIYANEITYQISRILILESSTHEKTKNEELKSAIESSYDSLEKLKDDFSKFSETAIITL